MKTFAEHLNELKNRLAICFGVLMLGTLVGFIFHGPVERILQRPLNQTLYYTSPAGGLSFVMQIALGVGLLLCLPVLLFELLQFARPAFKPVKTKFIGLIILCSLVLTALAVFYAYFLSLPAALHFLVTFNTDSIKALIGVNEYLRFLFAYIAGTVVAFQLPLILYFANRIRRFPPGTLLRLQRPAIVGAIVFAGIVTPTVDPINQLLVAAPIVALFEVGALAVLVANRSKQNQRAIRNLGSFEIKPVGSVSTAPAALTARSITMPVQTSVRSRPHRTVAMDVFIPA